MAGSIADFAAVAQVAEKRCREGKSTLPGTVQFFNHRVHRGQREKRREGGYVKLKLLR